MFVWEDHGILRDPSVESTKKTIYYNFYLSFYLKLFQPVYSPTHFSVRFVDILGDLVDSRTMMCSIPTVFLKVIMGLLGEKRTSNRPCRPVGWHYYLDLFPNVCVYRSCVVRPIKPLLCVNGVDGFFIREVMVNMDQNQHKPKPRESPPPRPKRASILFR